MIALFAWEMKCLTGPPRTRRYFVISQPAQPVSQERRVHQFLAPSHTHTDTSRLLRLHPCCAPQNPSFIVKSRCPSIEFLCIAAQLKRSVGARFLPPALRPHSTGLHPQRPVSGSHCCTPAHPQSLNGLSLPARVPSYLLTIVL